jgi:hypothetical protein
VYYIPNYCDIESLVSVFAPCCYEHFVIGCCVGGLMCGLKHCYWCVYMLVMGEGDMYMFLLTSCFLSLVIHIADDSQNQNMLLYIHLFIYIYIYIYIYTV